MLLSGLKKYVFHTQMRQFATFPMYTRTKVRKEATNQWNELKYSHSSNPTLGVYRLFNTDSEKKIDKLRLPALMLIYPDSYPSIPFIKFLALFVVLRLTVDRSFNLLEFFTGVKQAMLVISHALGAQDYQALEGMVKDRTIKLLKGRVDRLNYIQRQLIPIDPRLFYFFPVTAKLWRDKGTRDMIFEVDVHGIYTHDAELMFTSAVSCGYKFQRKYKDGVGGEWIVKMLCHLQQRKRVG